MVEAPRRSPVRQRLMELSALGVNTAAQEKVGWVTQKKKKGLARRTCPNKRVNEETDSRRVEEKENNLRRRIKREEAREAKEE